MNEKEHLYQAMTLVVVVLFFDFLERLYPGYRVHRRRDLPLNVLSLLIVIVAGEIWKTVLLNGFNGVDPGGLISWGSLRRLPGLVKLALGLVSADFCLYWIHRAMHRTWLWRTHTFHHSIEELWWLSGSRTSLTHLFLFSVPQIFLAYRLLDLTPEEAGVAFSVGVVVNVWIHTNLRVNLGRLGRMFITPSYHRIHHGDRGLSAKNLGFIFTLWDRIFGTYVNPQTTRRGFDLGFVSTRKRLLLMIVGI